MNDVGLPELRALAAIAARRSFRQAADELGLSPSTLSHMMRELERRMGIRLLHRTTRSVAPTDAGARLIARLQPLLRDLDMALAETASEETISGTLRLNAAEQAGQQLLETAVPVFLQRHPSVTLDLVINGRLIDIVAEGFDAGIRLGESVPKDMVAVRFGGPGRFVPVAAPAYLAVHGVPATPDALTEHACIRVRLPSGKPYDWEFGRHGQEMTVAVGGSLILDAPGLMIEAARKGLGIAYVWAPAVRRLVAEGQLIVLLEPWCPAIPGLSLYYPGHRHVPPALRAFIDVLKMMPSEG